MHIFASPEKASVRRLLTDNNLPTADLDELDLSCFLGCGSQRTPAGVIGLEIYQQDALLRSLVVAHGNRSSGCGQALVAAIESFASDKGVHNLFLLTETAEHFFSQQGYEIVDRDQVPTSMKKTKEFSALCPQSAVAMTKTLANNQTKGID